MVRFAFGEFILDADTRQLLRGSREVHLSPKAFDLLKVLIDRRPTAIAKQQLHTMLWPGTFVSDTNLPTLIAEIRTSLDDDPKEPRFVRTVHRFGYAFCGAVASDAAREPPGLPLTYLLTWERRTFPLMPGENIVGRDPNCGVWLPLPGVSRRHARIVVVGESVTVEDLGSKNGTLVHGAALTSSFRLRDGDSVRIGPATLTLRIASTSEPTQTESPA